MSFILKISKFAFNLIIGLLVVSCAHDRQVVPYDLDIDEIYKALEPNDEETPEGVTYGKNNIQGFIFDYDFTTDNQDIYVYFANFTAMDINPAITQHLFEFVEGQLHEFGFVSDSLSLPSGRMEQLISEGLNYKEAAARIIDYLKEGFEANVPEIEKFDCPFNITFQVYPIYLDDNYVTYRELSYSYTGGAHGMTESYLITYDLKSGKPLTPEEIIKPERMSEVSGEVAAHMAYSYPIYENITTVEQYIDSLNVWVGTFNGEDAADHDNRITAANFPLEDVALTKEGLAVVYQMYELTPGSDGVPIVVIPYRDIRGCLNDNISN